MTRNPKKKNKKEKGDLGDEELSHVAGGVTVLGAAESVKLAQRFGVLASEYKKSKPQTRPQNPTPDVFEKSKVRFDVTKATILPDSPIRSLLATLQSPKAQSESISKFQTSRKLLESANQMRGEALIDKAFAHKIQTTLRAAIEKIEHLPDIYMFQGKPKDARARRDAVKHALEYANDLVENLNATNIDRMIKIGIGSALDIDGTLKQVLEPIVQSISQFISEPDTNLTKQSAFEKRVTETLVAVLKKLPFAIATREELKAFAKKNGEMLNEENSGEMAKEFRKQKLSKETLQLQSALEDIGLKSKTAKLISSSFVSPLNPDTPLRFDLGEIGNDPYNVSLLMHILTMTSEILPAFTQSDNKTIELLSDKANIALADLAENLPSVDAGLKRLSSKKNKETLNKKLDTSSKMLSTFATLIKGSALRVKSG